MILLYPSIVKYKVLRFPCRKLCQLSNYCISNLKSPFIACFVKMDVGPLNIVPLPVSTMFSFKGRGQTPQEEFPLAAVTWVTLGPGSRDVHAACALPSSRSTDSFSHAAPLGYTIASTPGSCNGSSFPKIRLLQHTEANT